MLSVPKPPSRTTVRCSIGTFREVARGKIPVPPRLGLVSGCGYKISQGPSPKLLERKYQSDPVEHNTDG